MDFLDSLDLDVSNKKSRRVRSWYLYEQFKSLERNQVDAAKRLKDRSYQDRILRQELAERKARRQLYDQFGQTHSECRIERNAKSEGAKTDLSTDDFFESFYELQDDRVAAVTDCRLSDACTHDKLFEDDFKSIDEPKDDTSYAESINSVVNAKSEETITEGVKESVGEEHDDVVDEINYYFDEVKDNLEQIEKLTELEVDDKTFENDSLFSIEELDMPPIMMKDKTVNTCDSNNVFAMWSKLVSFAYQIIQLNHGNCYVDYGSQFLTAVLACDVLRRGINRMCHILQRYVCPINLATNDSDASTASYKSVKRKNCLRTNTSRYTCTDKIYNKLTRHQITRKYRSENSWQHRSGYSADNKTNGRNERASEPWRSIPNICVNHDQRKSLYKSCWPDFSNDDLTERFFRESCKCRYKVLNPMLKLSQHIDSMLKEIDDTIL